MEVILSSRRIVFFLLFDLHEQVNLFLKGEEDVNWDHVLLGNDYTSLLHIFYSSWCRTVASRLNVSGRKC